MIAHVVLGNGTPCRVDLAEGDAWELTYGERNGIGEERWSRLDASDPRCREAFLLAEMETEHAALAASEAA